MAKAKTKNDEKNKDIQNEVRYSSRWLKWIRVARENGLKQGRFGSKLLALELPSPEVNSLWIHNSPSRTARGPIRIDDLFRLSFVGVLGTLLR